MHLYIIRHGESLQNVPGWTPTGPTRPDVPLTERGREQVAALAKWMPDHYPQIDIIYSSTMLRAMDTASALGEALACEVIGDDRLRDGGGNRADGTPYPLDALPVRTSISTRDNPHHNFVQDEHSEAYINIRRRAALFLHEIVEKHPDQHVIAVTHSGCYNALLDTMLNAPIYRLGTFGMTYTSISHIQYRPDVTLEQWIIWYLGRIDHLNGAT